MPSSKTYFEFIQKQLSALEEVTYRAMMVDNVDDRAFLEGLFRAMYAELPAPHSRCRHSKAGVRA